MLLITLLISVRPRQRMTEKGKRKPSEYWACLFIREGISSKHLQIMYLYIDIFCPSCRESIKVLTLRDLPNAQNLAFQLHFGFWPGPNWLSVGLIGAAFSFTHTKKGKKNLSLWSHGWQAIYWLKIVAKPIISKHND